MNKIDINKSQPASVFCNPLFVRRYHDFTDPWNPMYADPEYSATHTGEVRVMPLFLAGALKSQRLPQLPDMEGKIAIQTRAGADYRFYKPVRAGETYKLICGENSLTELESSRDGVREYSYADSCGGFYDSKGEPVMSIRRLTNVRVQRDYETPNQSFKKHWYTEEEKARIQEIMDAEEVRADNTPRWEDTAVGDEITPATYGPMTPLDMIFYSGAVYNLKSYPLRRLREVDPEMAPRSSENNAWRVYNSFNFTDDAEAGRITGVPASFMIPEFCACALMRLATNWAGNDGFIREMSWRHLRSTPLYDCSVAYGTVAEKFRDEAGCGCVLLDAYLKNICRDQITDTAKILVRLPSGQ